MHEDNMATKIDLVIARLELIEAKLDTAREMFVRSTPLFRPDKEKAAMEGDGTARQTTPVRSVGGDANIEDANPRHEGDEASRPSAPGGGRSGSAIVAVSSGALNKAITASRWVELGGKFLAFATAVCTFVITAGKLVQWLKGRQVHVGVGHASGLDVLSTLVGLYVLVYLLFFLGNALLRLFDWVWQAFLSVLQRLPGLKARVDDDTFKRLKETAPRLFELGWDLCVIVLAILPGLRYTVTVLG